MKLVTCYAVLFVLTSLLAGFYSAAVLSNYKPARTLDSRFNLTGKNYLQKSLVIFQFALASFLIIGSIAVFSQLNYLTTQNLGYDDIDCTLFAIWNLQPAAKGGLIKLFFNLPATL